MESMQGRPPAAEESADTSRRLTEDQVPQVPVETQSAASVTEIGLHVGLCVLAVTVLLAAFMLGIEEGQRVVLPMVDIPLPELCTAKRLLGIDCPGCGLTRCFISVSQGRVSDALRYHPAGLLWFSILVFQIPYRGMQLWRIRRGYSEYNLHTVGTYIVIAAFLLTIGQWLVRMVDKFF
ncbi:MAG: DUF2752 domain-containing protein [Pirellulaceae bacterium]|nr:DUF2752 domain-containing protein [Pirellulaceae bacterium]